MIVLQMHRGAHIAFSGNRLQRRDQPVCQALLFFVRCRVRISDAQLRATVGIHQRDVGRAQMIHCACHKIAYGIDLLRAQVPLFQFQQTRTPSPPAAAP